MTPDRWSRTKEILEAAWEMETGSRAAFLDQACAGDPELLAHVQSLLESDEAVTGFLSEPAVDMEAVLSDGAGDARPELTGTRIGRYAVQNLIGKGGMGAVYRAVREDDFRMEVAIKLLKRGTDTDAALEHFAAERQILAALQHPNIAHVIDGGATESGLPYFVMEYVDGKPLLEYAAPLPIRERLNLFRSVCGAVQYAHQKLIVHRDIKPANILVTSDGTPKLLDFGIAKLLDPARDGAMTVTAAGSRFMTPQYASPEQVRGEPVTTATDVYSLGAVLYELLTGKQAQPMDGTTPESIAYAICKRDPPKPSALLRDVDADLDKITLMALRKEPDRRYGSVEQFSEDIQRYLQGRPVRARKVTVWYRTSKFVRRNRIGVAVATLMAAGLISGVAAVQRQARRAERRFQQVRKLANTVLFDLEREIEPLPGATNARELVIKTALAYLDSLAADGSGDPLLQEELATAYERVGDVQGSPQGSNLGHPEAALDSYNKAQAIAQRLRPSAAALGLVAGGYFKRGLIYAWTMGRPGDAEKQFQMAIRIADSIPVKTGQPGYFLRSHARATLGDLLTYRDPAAALVSLTQALEISRQFAAAQRDDESRFLLSITMVRLAVALQETGNLPESVNMATNALNLIDQLLHEQPGNARFQRERTIYYERLAWVTGHPQFFNLGDSERARGLMVKMVADCKRIMAADPADFRARFDLSEALGEFGAVIRESDPVQAEQVYRQSLNLSTTVIDVTPNDSNALYSQAFNRVGLAWVLEKLGKRGEAIAMLDAAITSLQAVVQRHADEVRCREYVALALYTRGGQRLRAGDVTAAANDLEKSRAILEPLYRENPRKLTCLRDLAECYQAYGDLHATRLEWRLAQEWYRKSFELWERWRDVAPSTVYDQQRRAKVAHSIERVTKELAVESHAK